MNRLLQVMQGIDVRPHPHINLATVTYLIEGEILHRDSLGTEQAIRPGAVNWMKAGKGNVHSERTSDALKLSGQRLFGLQTWMALPEAQRVTVLLVYIEGRSYQEAADTLEIPIGTVMSRLPAARAKLASRMNRRSEAG